MVDALVKAKLAKRIEQAERLLYIYIYCKLVQLVFGFLPPMLFST